MILFTLPQMLWWSIWEWVSGSRITTTVSSAISFPFLCERQKQFNTNEKCEYKFQSSSSETFFLIIDIIFAQTEPLCL